MPIPPSTFSHTATLDDQQLLSEIGIRLYPLRDELAEVWARRLVERIGTPFSGNPEAIERITELNRWFLERHLQNLRRSDLGTIFRDNFESDVALLRSQGETDPTLRSTLSQLYLSLQISTDILLERLTELFAADPRLPRILSLYARLAVSIGEVVGTAFYEVRTEATEQALRTISSLLETSRELNTRSTSVAGVLSRLTEIVNRLVRCDKSLVFLWHESEQAYVAEASLGFAPEHFGELHGIRFRAGDFPVMDDVLAGRVVHGDRNDGRVPRDLMERYQENTYAVAPISDADGRPLGTLAAYRTHAELFDDTDLGILAGVAQNAALAIENARLLERLQQSSRLKSDFINSMSHEIRTPINVLVGYLEILEDRCEERPEDREILRRMNQNTGYLLDLVNTILDVGRIEAGKVPLRIEEFSVDEILRSLHDVFSATAASRHLGFQCHTESALPRLRTDRLKLLEVLNNLVANALKFTDRGSVQVYASGGAGNVEFQVRDTGIGIEPDDLDHIFDVFRQTGTADRGGTGLGLYIVKRLSKLLGGQVRAESRHGQGSVFRVSIPASLAETDAEPPASASAGVSLIEELS